MRSETDFRKEVMNQNMANDELIYRSANIEGDSAINEEARTVEICFSSETPVERSFGYEVLDHKAESVDLKRLNTKGPLLLEHDTNRRLRLSAPGLTRRTKRAGHWYALGVAN